jgi:hypothetical protein
MCTYFLVQTIKKETAFTDSLLFSDFHKLLHNELNLVNAAVI